MGRNFAKRVHSIRLIQNIGARNRMAKHFPRHRPRKKRLFYVYTKHEKVVQRRQAHGPISVLGENWSWFADEAAMRVGRNDQMINWWSDGAACITTLQAPACHDAELEIDRNADGDGPAERVEELENPRELVAA